MDFQPSDNGGEGDQNQPSAQPEAGPNPGENPDPRIASARNAQDLVQSFVISGIEIKFPCQPYTLQKAIMTEVLETINTKTESKKPLVIDAGPGSGKTLAILSSLLAWQNHQTSMPLLPPACGSTPSEKSPSCSPSKKFKSPCCTTPRNQILWAVKTITEITEISAQLRKSCYSPQLCILAGKSYLCLPARPRSRNGSRRADTPSEGGPSASNGDTNTGTTTPVDEAPDEDFSDVADDSGNLARSGTCVKCKCVQGSFPGSDPPAPNLWPINDICSFGKSFRNSRENSPFEIRHLVEEGAAKKFCPYYCAIHMSKSAELILCTYNYLLDGGIRESCDIDLSNCLVVIDEAHNLGEKCRETLTKRVTKHQLERALAHIQQIENPNQVLSQSAQTQVRSMLPSVISPFEKLITAMSDNSSSIRTQRLSNEEPRSSYEAFGNILSNLDFSKDQINSSLACLSTLTASTSNISDPARNAIYELRAVLENFKFLQSFLPKDQEGFVITVNEIGDNDNAKNKDVELKVIFLKTLLLFNQIKAGAQSLILLSGAFPPLPFSEDYLVSELFGERNSFQHWNREGTYRSFDTDALFVSFIRRRLNRDDVIRLDSKNEIHPENLNQLATTISAILSLVPHGAIIVFRTRMALVHAITYWYSTGALELLSCKKQLFTETPLRDEALLKEDYLADFIGAKSGMPLEQIVAQYKEASVTLRGAVFFQYCRGNLTEGVNWIGNECRVLISAGVPYPDLSSIGMREKQTYNDRMINQGYISGNQWYGASAMVALNAVFGRAIRGPNDWGLVFAIEDQFYTRGNECKQISSWVTDSWKEVWEWENILPYVRDFIQLHHENPQLALV